MDCGSRCVFVIGATFEIIRTVYDAVAFHVIMIMCRLLVMIMVITGAVVGVTAVGVCLTGVGMDSEGKHKDEQ